MRTALVLLALALTWTGCDYKDSQPIRATAKTPSTSKQASAANPQSSPGEVAQGSKTCFNCGGTGLVVCTVPGCTEGMVDCPGPCLKLSQGVWEHINVEGHRPDELWRRFNNRDDNGWQAWNQDHVGEVIEMREGKPVNTGKCGICRGNMRLKCSACDGTSQALCHICDGKRVVPESWTAFNNPKLKNPPRTIRLKDGRTILGRIEMQIGSRVTIRTEDGNLVEIETRDIASGTPAR